MEVQAEENSAPHVLIFPLPAQGHVNSMLNLAQLLALHNLHVTFLNTEYIHNRLIRFNDIQALSAARYPTLHFKTISDSYTENQHPGFGSTGILDVFVSLSSRAKPFLREILASKQTPGIPKVSSIIIDGVFGNLATDLAAEFGIQLIHFRTFSACCYWAYFCVPKLYESNELPIRGDDDMDRVIRNIPGMENLLRCRDLPSSCRSGTEIGIPVSLDSIVNVTHQSQKADAFILNTFEDLEGPVVSQIRLHFPRLFTLGPLHYHLNTRITEFPSKQASNSFKSSLYDVDRSCMTWLDSQAKGSVIYVSFGSMTPLKREQMMEIWHGLVNSKKRFLWVVRPDAVKTTDSSSALCTHSDVVPDEVEEGTKKRGLIVGWAPQEEVLAHEAVGGFLTHSGWNSTLESVVAGVPMICWPFFADQQVNSRFVSDVWKLGMDMKDVCDRKIVEKMVNDLMDHKREEFQRSAKEMAKLAHTSVSECGSSHSNLNGLIRFIKSNWQDGDTITKKIDEHMNSADTFGHNK